jgi:HAE1 family hydrophobic/amphiphilic exporter-1
MNLSEPFIRRPVMTMVVTVSVILFGVLSFLRLPVDALPSVDYPIIVVNAVYPGASPETMASTVATPLERQFMQINGLELVTSKSVQGHTQLTLQFVLEKSLDAAATDVQTAISQATPQLPVDLPSPPTFSKNNPNDQPLMYIAITSDTVTKGKLYDYASTQLGQKLSILPGVSRVEIFGAKSAIRIKVDPSELAARRLTVDDVAEAVRKGTSTVGAGQLEGSFGSSVLRPLGQLDTAEGYGNLIVASQGGSPVYLRDVADVRESLQDERINLKFYVRGREVPPATLVAAVTRRAGANAVEVARSIRAELPAISAGLPSSVLITPIYDRSWSIVRSVADVEETLLIAFVLVVLVIFVFLGRATDTLIPAVAMPLSLLLTFIAMRFLGYSIDNLSLMALTLAIGFLVDDAIVFLENTVRRMEHGEKALEAAVNGAKEISFTIVSMTISLAAVFVPLVFMPGQVGRVFREFAVTIIIAIGASGLVSLTLTPLMCSRMLRDRGPGSRRTWMERVFGAFEKRVLAGYGGALGWFLRHKWISAVAWAGCLIGTYVLFTSIPKTFLPPGDSSVVFGVFMAREGSSPEQMRAYQDQVYKVLADDPDVERSISITGATGFLNSNQGMSFTFLKPADQRIPIDQKAGELMFKLGQIPGIFAIQQPWPVLEIKAGAVSQNQGQYSYAISGVNPAEVYETAWKLFFKLNEQRGKLFQSVFPDLQSNTPNLEVSIRREQARTQGVSESRILSLLQSSYAQNYVYLIKKPEDQYQVIVEVADSARSNPDDLGLLYIRSDDGANLVPLNTLVEWKRTVGLQAVHHLNQFTSVSISINVMTGVALGDAT